VPLHLQWASARVVFLARTVEALDRRAGPRAARPRALRAEGEARQLGMLFDGADRLLELLDVDAVEMLRDRRHVFPPFLVRGDLASRSCTRHGRSPRGSPTEGASAGLTRP